MSRKSNVPKTVKESKGKIEEVMSAEPRLSTKYRKEYASLTAKKSVRENKEEVAGESPIQPSINERALMREWRHIKPAVITGVLFGIMSDEEIKGKYKCEVITPEKSTATGALQDPMMGPSAPGEPCGKCALDDKQCIGHRGYIELAVPIYNPAFIRHIKRILAIFDMHAYTDSIRARDEYMERRLLELKSEREQKLGKKIKTSLTQGRNQLEDEAKIREEPNFPKIEIRPVFDKKRVLYDHGNKIGLQRLKVIAAEYKGRKAEGKSKAVEYKVTGHYISQKGENKDSDIILDPSDVRKFLDAIDNDVDMEGNNMNWSQIIGFGDNKLKSLVMRYLPVLPNTLTPTTVLQRGRKVTNMLLDQYAKIVTANNEIKEYLANSKVSDVPNFFKLIGGESESSEESEFGRRKRNKPRSTSGGLPRQKYDALNNAYFDLLYAKDETFDDENAFSTKSQQVMSIYTNLNGKYGAFRGDALGKRSNFSGRAVIIGNPEIDVDEIGIPEYFTDITIPEEIKTDEDIEIWNEHLPKTTEDGTELPTPIVRIERNKKPIILEPNVPFELRIGDIVRRKLRNGDPIPLERQPVLHKGSFMAFKARIMPATDGNVLQLHPANTSPYGADFDGDEMNMYVPQDLFARADVLKNMMVSNCIRSDQNSGAMIGLIQNSVLAASNLTRNSDIIVNKLVIDEMFRAAQFDRRNPDNNFHTNPVELMRKAEGLGLVPVSGRVVFSLFLPKGFFYQRKPDVSINDGILFSGMLKKRDLGNTSNGIVDAILDQFGPQTVITFLSAVQRALGVYIERTGFSLGQEDCMLNKIGEREEGEKTIDDLIYEAKQDVINILANSENLSTIEKDTKESEVRKIITLVQDRIAKIVKSGGIDIAKVKNQITDETSNKSLIEAITFVINNTKNRDLQSELRKFINDTKTSKKRNITDYAKEQKLLEETIDELRNENEDELPSIPTESFTQSVMFGTTGNILRQQYIDEINDSIKLRMKIFGAHHYDDNFLRIVLSGAKGTELNILQVKGLLGQQLIDDKRPGTIMTDGTRSLPYYKERSADPESQAFCASSYRKGLNVVEFFLHAKANRNNMVEANLKPSDTGYFYRRLALALESLRTTPSGSVVDANGRMVQTFYGGDGFDARMTMNIEEESGGGRRTKTLVPQFVNVDTLVKSIRHKSGKLNN